MEALRSGPIRAVTFDAAGTLFGLRQPVGTGYGRVARAHGVAVSDESLQAAFEELFPQMPPLAFPPLPEDELLRRERRWWRDLVRRVFARATPGADCHGPQFDEIFNELFELYGGDTRWEAYPETASTLRSLRGAETRVGLVSNFDSRVERVLEELGLLSLLDSVTISSRAGAVKPDAEIFRAAVSNLEVDAGETLHVGDELRADWQGARDAGLQALLLDREARYGSRTDLETVPDLTAVVEYLAVPLTAETAVDAGHE